jgi:hypothetical protein
MKSNFWMALYVFACIAAMGLIIYISETVRVIDRQQKQLRQDLFYEVDTIATQEFLEDSIVYNSDSSSSYFREVIDTPVHVIVWDGDTIIGREMYSGTLHYHTDTNRCFWNDPPTRSEAFEHYGAALDYNNGESKLLDTFNFLDPTLISRIP